VMYRIVHEDPVALPSGAFAGLPADLGPVIATALAKDPADRFADAGAFRASLAGAPIVTGRAAGVPGAASASAPASQWGSPAVAATQSRSTSNWMPYAVVAALGVIVLAWFAFAGPQGSATAPAQVPAVATSTIPAESAPAATPEPAGMDVSESRALLGASYSQIVSFGKPKTGRIGVLAARWSNEVGSDTISSSTISEIESLISDIQTAGNELSAAEVDSSLSDVKSVQLELLELCTRRARVLIDAADMVNSGSGDWKVSLDEGRAAKVSYERLLPSAKP